ncbi:glycoside hydrolase family 127 protein [Echinicola shivajiensis]|uniref:glycoside hydrolase family 127 protein n=1 Tax=Echinicola shivajiensis TaxID=1035916 RepID=UPI001BFC5EF7|nr:glycoside hydrolase family 127 protein [Echinicola shivajiensis]
MISPIRTQPYIKQLFSCFLLLTIGILFPIQSSQSQSYLPTESEGKLKVKSSVAIQAYPFNLNEVKLLPSPFLDAMEADESYLLFLKPDRLLSQFRSHAGLEPKDEVYGGWESMGLAGHSLGHYLSALSMHYASTGKKEFLDRINYTVDELALCQQARKTGYIGAIPNEDKMWAEVASGHIRSRGFDLNGAWAPWYTVHKIMAGLMDAYLYAGNKKALEINIGIADWADNLLKELSEDQIQEMLKCEYGGMNEALVNTYALTGNNKYLELSYKFHDNFVLKPLEEKINPLPGKHSNTQIPKVIGATRRYELTGNKDDQIIGTFFWNTMVDHHSYAPGGNANYEYLGAEDELNDKLTDNTMETCNTHNMLKLTRHLFALEPSAKLMNYYERALYNHILASQNPDTGMMCYFVPLRMGTRKWYSNKEHSFTCCVGTGMENHVKYGESIYFKSPTGGLYVNLFIPSELNWEEKGLKITQESQLPKDGKTKLRINTSKKSKFPIMVRKPSWAAASEVKIKINGKTHEAKLGANGYFILEKKWKDGDQITFEFPMNLYAVEMPDNNNRKAYFYGPVLLSGVFGDTEPDPLKGIPALVSEDQSPNKIIQQSPENPLIFTTNNIGQPNDVKLIPFNQTKEEYYTVYWDVFTPEEWEEQENILAQQRQEELALEAKTVDKLRLGEMQPERDHDFEGEKTKTGEEHRQRWRSAEDGGYFSFTLSPKNGEKHQLICSYWGMDNRGRNFDIFVDDVKIATEDLNQYKDSKFYHISYDIPLELTKGKDTFQVKFVPHENNTAGPVYGEIKLIKK